MSGLRNTVRTLAVLYLLWVLLCAWRARAWHPGGVRCLLLEIEARSGRIFLRFRGDDPSRSTRLRQVPLVRLAGLVGVLGAPLHVQAILADELDVASLVRRGLLVLRLVAAGHDHAADVLLIGVAGVARSLLVASNPSSYRKIALNVDLT